MAIALATFEVTGDLFTFDNAGATIGTRFEPRINFLIKSVAANPAAAPTTHGTILRIASLATERGSSLLSFFICCRLYSILSEISWVALSRSASELILEKSVFIVFVFARCVKQQSDHCIRNGSLKIFFSYDDKRKK